MLRRRNALFIVTLGMLSALLGAACGDGESTPTPTTTPPITQEPAEQATIKDFILPNLTVTVGTTVTWTNQDGASHTTTSGQNGQFDSVSWDSSTLPRGQSFSYTFDQVGTFAYTCKIHPSMNGTMTVTEGATSGSSGSQTSGSSESDY